ncbi:MAG TPA: ABC transporter ATP-binding protein [Alphaproteobacteria bacterium]|nr:ABC transporter ATP-binding protein [Alphaproteobacteria bacterium]
MEKTDAIISVRNLTKRFGPKVVAVDDVSFDVQRGEFFALLGPSGCGKTTVLRLIAGFENPSEGNILLDGASVEGVDPNKRPVNMVFQNYAVFPHMTVAQNVGYGLKVAHVRKAEIGPKVAEALRLVRLEGYEERKPDQLSGGERQRVALARALIKKPKVLLLDEPLSALDAKLRVQMRQELVELQKSVGITFIIVTHDQNEALSMADRIAVMACGVVRQIAPPIELYEQPNSRFVADFIGRVNLFDGRVVGLEDGRVLIEAKGLGRIAVPHRGKAEGEVALAVRPEKVQLVSEEPRGSAIRLQGRVVDVAYYGDENLVGLRTEEALALTVNLPNVSRSTLPRVAVGDRLWATWAPEDCLLLTE